MAIKSRRAVFLDKDGTLIIDVPYNVDTARIQLNPYAGESLRQLQDQGYTLIVVSNQSGVARGAFPARALDAVSGRIQELLKPYGVRIDAFYYCPHLPDGRVAAYRRHCFCRKPLPGLLQLASEKHQIDLRRSWMVGDILNDVEAGNRAGCRTVLLDNGNETEWLPGDFRKPDAVIQNLNELPSVIAGRAITV